VTGFHTKKRVSHSAENMFALVADVERYPEFVPMCDTLHVRKRGHEGAHEVLITDMTVSYKFVREKFSSKVRLEPEAWQICVEYLDGPFKKLDNRWRFHPLGPSACEIDFFISYEFRSRTLQMLMGGVFDHAFRKFTTAFIERADFVYGRGQRVPTPGNGGAAKDDGVTQD
jgi:coenzyme Q-binding protein COQ10